MRGSRSASGYRGSTFGSDAVLFKEAEQSSSGGVRALRACACHAHALHDPCALAGKHDDDLVMAWTRTTPVTGHHVPNRLKRNRRFDTQPFATVFVLTDPIYWDAVLPIVMDILCSS
ncbi:hypothetical protein PHYSODRAFT_333214 [Phytophthora sojae]|uniref:Uncharacterized protein n=1 Tax=Phytophthora sojae (strain P6497) TaxID=1094619 RepID=G4ZL05_PHYSP|nr:hypothetical protein PHYSODRAFT_333214 [Phytophthora sojae]EGZ14923.1 hypothetical protein PHYSODRAFT_333214 [Phytophthora sojae]|eukprot:XP_009528672.1 hypothetical protein PHYSODRAFT_333214 [Phytophthora sojae]